MGVETPRNGTWGGMLHRNWLVIRSLINLGDPEVVLLEAERGEKHTAELCDRALDQADDPRTEALLKRHKRDIADTKWRLRVLLESNSLSN